MKKIYAVSIFLLIGLISFSQTNTWDGSSNTNWSNAANWSLNVVPTAAHNVVINISASISVDVTPPNLNSLTISSTVSFTSSGANRIITISGTGLSIQSGGSLTLSGANPGGGTSMGIAFSGTSVTSSIAGYLILTAAGNGSSYVATNSLTSVSGSISNNGGTITSASSNLSFVSTGTYNHGFNGGTIPSATWATTANCNVTGITSTTPAGLTQSFGNFTWNCANHSATINLGSALTTVNGNFTVNQAGNPSGIRVTNPLVLSANTNLNLNVGGNFTVSNTGVAAWVAMTNGTAAVTINVAGNFNMSGSTTFFDYNIGSTQSSSLIVNVSGNYVQSGGFLDWAFTPASGSVASELRVAGNFSHTGSSIISTSIANTASTVPNGKIIFNKAGSQAITSATPTNIGYTNYEVNSGSTLQLLSNLYLYSSNTARWGGNFTARTGSVLNFGTYLLQSQATGVNNSFVLESAAKVITANNNGLQNGTVGSVSTSIATRTYNSGADYEFQGLATGTFVTSPVAATTRDIIINNTTGNVTLSQPLAVTRELALQSGIFITTAVNLITINDNAVASGASNAPARFVSGPVRKIGNDAFTFPVGKSNYWYRYCGISAPANTTDAFTAEFFYANPYLLGPVTVPNLIITNCEYWTIDRTSGTSTVDVVLSWSSIGGCNPAIFTLNVNELVGAHFNGSSWNLTGGMGVGTVPSGEVTWSGYSAFNTGSNPFVIGTLSPLQIPLDVRLTDVRAYKNGNGNQVEWTNLTESNVRSYVVERSADGRQFTAIGGKLPAVNNGSRASYSFNDATPFDAVTYYRILITEMDGRMSYSKIVKVQPDGSLTSGFSVYPNPAKDGQVSLTMSGMQKGQYQLIVTNAIGQSVYTKTINYRGGSMTEVLNFPATLGKGLYNMVISNTGFRKATSLVIQ